MNEAQFMPAHLIAHRRRIIEWRDRHSLDAELALCRFWADFRPEIVEVVEEVSWRSAIVEPKAFIRREIDPLLAAGFGPRIEQLLTSARNDLKSIVDTVIEIDRAIAATDGDEDHFEAAADVLTGLMPLAGGLVMGASLPSLAVVSGTAVFGLVATSTVSLPILFGGLAASGAALATGVVKTKDLHALRSRRMVSRIDTHVRHAILSPEDKSEVLSVLARLRQALALSAELAMEELS